MNCPTCETENPEYARFCLNCGVRLETAPGVICPRCGVGLPARARFCFACGASLTTAAGERAATGLAGGLERLMPKQYIEQLQAAKGRIAGERRVVTILFSDVKGSTAMAENLDPEEVMEIMNGAFEVLIEPIYRYEGTLARLMGDAILAFFGAPIAHEDDPERACRAALDIIAGVRQYAERLQRERGIRGFNVRVGINTGLVVVGEVGADLRVEYTAMGDVVNLAARMENAAEPGTVLITEDTQRLIKHSFETAALGPLQVKGKSEPVRVFRLQGLKSAPSFARDSETLWSPLVGRDAELSQLQTALRALSESTGGLVALNGEAGLGKTRLVAEAHRALTSNVTWAEGHCLSYAEGMSYWSARQVLCSLIGVSAESPSSEVGRALQSSVEQLQEIYPYLARLLDVPLEDALAERLEHLGADVLQQRMKQAFREYVRARALAQPLVMVWEDLHWVDPSSLNLLEELLPLTAEVPLLSLLVFRPNEGRVSDFHQRAARNYSGRYQVIALAPLARADSAQLLDYLLTASSTTHAVTMNTRNLILEKAEGNPFFLEEMTRALLDTGANAAPIHVPETLQGVIMARIDRLPPPDKRVLQTAAVMGRTFNSSVLTRVLNSEMTPGQIQNALSELSRREFIAPSATLTREAGEGRGGSEEYTFKHNLTLEVTYNSLLIAQRKTLHKQAGEAMEAQFPDRLEEMAAPLARHFEKAESHAKASNYLIRAGDRAARLYANTEAIADYQRALALADEAKARLAAPAAMPAAPALLPAREGLGDVYSLTGEYAAALEQYEKALAHAQDPLHRAALQRKLGQVCEKWGKREQAIACFEAGLREMRQDLDAAEAARIYTSLGLVYYRRGDLDAALQLSTLALDLMERLGDEWGIARACNNLGIIHGNRGEWEEALAFHRRSLALWERLGDAYGLAGACNNLGLVFYQQGEWAHAVEQYNQSLALCERIGNRHGLAFTYDNLGQAYQKLGQADKAMECLMQAVRILFEIGESQIIPEMWQAGAW